MTITGLLTLKPIGMLTPFLQILLICILFVVTTVVQYRAFKRTGKMWAHYPVSTSSLFVPIYEEIIFRGIILLGLMSLYTILTAVIISSLLFGLWHFKNVFYSPKKELIYQMLYAGIVFGPVMGYLTIYTGTIWLAVILHYINNLFAPYFAWKKEE